MSAGVSAPHPLQAFAIHSPAMLVPGQEAIPPLLGEMIRLIDGHPNVGVPPPEVIGRSIARFVPSQVGVVMKMIRMLRHALINQGIL